MSVEIRRAGVADVESIVAFGSNVVPAHYGPILGDELANAQLRWWSRDRMRAAVEASSVHLALADDAVVAVVELGQWEGQPVIWKLYVAPDYRGRALGHSLLEHVIPDDADYVQVEHFVGNVRAAAFYEREGFRQMRVEPAGSGEPRSAVVWRRKMLRT